MATRTTVKPGSVTSDVHSIVSASGRTTVDVKLDDNGTLFVRAVRDGRLLFSNNANREPEIK